MLTLSCCTLYAVSKRSGDIREILSCGSIHAEDLNFLAVLGSGNCGIVYKLVLTEIYNSYVMTLCLEI